MCRFKTKSKQIFSFSYKYKNGSPQVLFASITPAYADIIKAAAQTCNMPYHQNR
jgi:hypothetical protein